MARATPRGGVAVGVLAAVCAAATLHFGAGIWADWWRHAVLAPLGTPNGWAHNQSLDAYLLRLFVPGAVSAVPAHAPAAPRILSLSLSLGVAAATVWILVKSARARLAPPLEAARVPLELGFLVLASLMLMKITWVHTLAGMLFLWPVLMVTIWRAAEQGAPWARAAGVLACTGFFLSSAHLPILWGDRLDRWPWVLLTGAHLAGLLVLWGAAAFLLRPKRRAA